MFAPERHAEIVARAVAEGRVDVTSLALALDVTQETIRRDLTSLERRGLVRRVHGGAVAVERLGLEPSLSEREQVNVEAKEAIAQAALAELPESGSIVLDGGSTTARLAALLPTDRDLTVLTHALPVASIVATRPGISLHLIGGHVRGRTLAAVGPWATAALAQIQADVAFVGTNGLSVERGLTTPDIAEAEVKSYVVRAARRIVVLADHTKVGRDELVTVAPLDVVDTLVTDSGTSPDLLLDIEAQGIRVVRA